MRIDRVLPAGAVVVTLGVVIALASGQTARAQNSRAGSPGTVNVHSVDEDAKTPFAAHITNFIEVPADKRLTIEYASVDCSNAGAASTATELILQVRTGGTLVEYPLPATFLQVLTGNNLYAGSHPVRLYADPGSFVNTLRIVGYTCNVSISGFLTPA